VRVGTGKASGALVQMGKTVMVILVNGGGEGDGRQGETVGAYHEQKAESGAETIAYDENRSGLMLPLRQWVMAAVTSGLAREFPSSVDLSAHLSPLIHSLLFLLWHNQRTLCRHRKRPLPHHGCQLQNHIG
jgi:hypothetical protein